MTQKEFERTEQWYKRFLEELTKAEEELEFKKLEVDALKSMVEDLKRQLENESLAS